MMKWYSWLLVLFAGLGCGPKQNGMVYFNDFENTKGWIPLYLNKEPHHSGSFSNKLDTNNRFGATFQLKLKDISERKIKKLKVCFWVLLNAENATSKFVVEVKDKDKNKVFYLAKNIDETVKTTKKWTKVDYEFTFPDENCKLGENTISMYVWDLGKSDIFVDDERVEFVI
jgi:hypothetical protein